MEEILHHRLDVYKALEIMEKTYHTQPVQDFFLFSFWVAVAEGELARYLWAVQGFAMKV